MATIKGGFNDKPTMIKISGRIDSRSAEIWIEETGKGNPETLSYATIEELIDLKEEVEQALKVILHIE